MTVPTPVPSSARNWKLSTTAVESRMPSAESQIAKRRLMIWPGVTGAMLRSHADAACPS